MRLPHKTNIPTTNKIRLGSEVNDDFGLLMGNGVVLETTTSNDSELPRTSVQLAFLIRLGGDEDLWRWPKRFIGLFRNSDSFTCFA